MPSHSMKCFSIANLFFLFFNLLSLHQILFASRIMLIDQCFIFLTPTHLSSEVENNKFYMLHAHFFPRDKKGCRATSHSKNCKASTYQSNRSHIHGSFCFQNGRRRYLLKLVSTWSFVKEDSVESEACNQI